MRPEITPVAYTLDLSIDPSSDAFTGRAKLEARLAAPTGIVHLNAEGLTLTKVTARAKSAAGGDVEADAYIGTAAHGVVELRFAEPLPAGTVTFSLAWKAALAETPVGLYRVQEEGRWYAFTQFEPMEARRMFPSIDQPEFKTPFHTTLRVPKGLTALSNTPETNRHDLGPETVFTFEQTRPLPTYLVAVAVGDFDIVPAPASAKETLGGVPLRVVTPKGKGKLAAYALETTPAILRALVNYFDMPFPFEKIDLVAVPNFTSGAMENVGLVTFREAILLLDRAQAGEDDRVRCQQVVAHELAHMWFGNYVTLEWWDDTWLNESFATWMESHVTTEVAPEFEAPLQSLAGMQQVMGLDSQKAARAIRQPIVHAGDVYNAFDGITYVKGASVLRMVETWIGRPAFRAGLKKYLTAHAYGTGRAANLIAELEAASGKPVGRVLDSFTKQAGVPVLKFTPGCEGDKLAVTISQGRYVGEAQPEAGTWVVPVCARAIGKTTAADKTECFLVEGADSRHVFTEARCDIAALHPNADQVGYYRWRLDPSAGGDWQAKLVADPSRLTLRERIALPPQLATQFDDGSATPATVLKSLEALSVEPHRLAVTAHIGALRTINRVARYDAITAERLAAFARRTLAPHVARVGFASRPGEPAADKLLRTPLMYTAADLGRDPAVINQARALADRALKDPASVSDEEADAAFLIAAIEADEAFIDRVVAAYKTATTPQRKSALLDAFGQVRSEALTNKVLGLTLDGTLRAQDFYGVTMPLATRPETGPTTWGWATSRYDEIVKLMGEKTAPRLPWLAAGFCTESERAEVAAYFAKPEHQAQGSDRNIALTLEAIDRCIRVRARTMQGLKEAL